MLSPLANIVLFLSGTALAQSAVSEDVYKNIIRYTGFAAAAYSDYCATPPSGSTVVKTFNVSSTDTQATLFRDDAAKEIIIAFRGSSSPKDLDTDFEFTSVPLTAVGTSCQSCKVHSGFQNAYASIASQVISAVKDELSSTGYSTLTITGHSLGAGLSSLATSSFIGSGIKVANTYTYGEPRNGDSAWVSYLGSQISDDNYFRVTHYNDGVPQIPPTVLGFEHHGPEYWQSKKSGNSAATTYNCGANSTSCNAGQDYGDNPINGAHLTYSNTVFAASLHNPSCGYSLL